MFGASSNQPAPQARTHWTSGMSSSTFSRASVPDMTLYNTLNIPCNANKEVIEQAYRTALRSAHPDYGGTPTLFKEVKQAYEVLSNDARRQA